MEDSNDEPTTPRESTTPRGPPPPEMMTQSFAIPMNLLVGLMTNMPMGQLNLMNQFNPIDQQSPTSLEERVTQASFHQQSKFKQVASKDFINSLSVQRVSQELVEQKTTCALCLEELELEEGVIELPCQDKHYFHIKKEGCDGIYPWLKENNTCPLCRHEFPSTEVEIEGEETIESPNRQTPIRITPRRIHNMVRQVIDDEEERMMQEALFSSLSK